MADSEKLATLTKKVAKIERQIGTQEDVNAIRSLQFAYGYYLDKCLWEEAMALYTDKCELHFMGSIYRGKAGIRRLYVGRIGKLFTNEHNGPVDGFMSDYLQMQDIVDVAPDRQSAQGRFRYLMQGANHATRNFSMPAMPPQWWESGVYENIYVKEDGVWKIQKLGLHLAWRADYQTGWRYASRGAGSAQPKLFPEDPLGPDEWVEGQSATWPKAHFHPFHYSHPVTGRVWDPQGQS